MTDTDVSVILRRLDRQDTTLDGLNTKLDAHIAEHKQDMKQLKPLAEGVLGAKVLGGGFKWVLGLILAVAGTITAVKQLWP